ncbi:hypothetical protein GNF86_19725, partial [Clostridium perfringens]
VEEIVTRYLKKEVQEQLEAQRKQAIPEVQIDTGKLHRLQRESDQVRDMLLTEEAGQQAEVINSLPALEPISSVSASSGHSESAGTSTNMASPSKGRSSRKSVAKKPDVFQAVMDFDADPYELDAIEVREQLDDADVIVRSVNTEQSESEAANGRSMEPSGSADDRLMQSMGSLVEHSSE